MREFIALIGGTVSLLGIWPYLRDTVKGKTKPRIVSWITWCLLTGISCAAALADRQYPTAILLFMSTLTTLSVVLLGLRRGNRKIERFDAICQAGALLGMILWFIFDSPAIAIVACVSIDFVGALPTFKHIWQKPYEETWFAYFSGAIGGALTVTAVSTWSITSLTYPIYLLVVQAMMAGVILIRNKYVVPGQPEELREL